MPCQKLPLPGGGIAIVCTRGRRAKSHTCAFCGKPGCALCDGVVPGIRRRGDDLEAAPELATGCDAKLCSACATKVGRDLDLCPRCVALGCRARG